MFTVVLFVMGGQAYAAGNEDAPGQEKKAEETESEEETEAESSESEEESSEEVTEAEESEEVDEEEADGSESSDDAEEAETLSDSGSERQPARKAGSSEPADDDDSSNVVESAEDCPNPKNREGEFTGNGANTSGDFDSTCDGSPALNGGKVHKNHCAGCVGNADNKNPPGQSLNDHNNGYECDGNNGVGKTNPAHSGCVVPPAPVPPKTCPDGRPMPSSGICDTPVRRPPLPDVIRRPSLPPDRVKPQQPFARPPEVPKWKPRRRIQSILPVTGPRDLLPFVWLALSLIAAGLASLATERRRRELMAYKR